MPLISRRHAMAGVIAAASTATISRPARASDTAPALSYRFPIWPNGAPGGSTVTAVEEEVLRSPDAPAGDTAWVHVRTPTLTYTPAINPNGAAILMIPGGGYRRVAVGHGGMRMAQIFAARGFAVYTLIYRLPADGWLAGADAPLQDAQRALRIIRSRAQSDGFDANRIAVMGGSAGGHLAARLLVRQDLASYAARDVIDALPLTPRVGCLLFPVVSTVADDAHAGSVKELFAPDFDKEYASTFAADYYIAPTTPPIFLTHAMDDKIVRWTNSVKMMTALAKSGIAQEAHFFQNGGHGFMPDGPTERWPDLFLAFAEPHGLLG